MCSQQTVQTEPEPMSADFSGGTNMSTEVTRCTLGVQWTYLSPRKCSRHAGIKGYSLPLVCGILSIVQSTTLFIQLTGIFCIK